LKEPPKGEKFVGKKGLVVFYHDCRVDEYNSDIATVKTTNHNKAMINIKGCFFVENVEHFQANEERLGDSPRCFTMLPATQGQINGYFPARRRRQFSAIVPCTLSIFEGARVVLLKNIDTKAGLVNGRRGTVKKTIMYVEVPGQLSAIEVEFDPLNNEDEIKVPVAWTRVDSYQFPDGNKIHFHQIPLKLCCAVTAHKAQDQTLSKIAVSKMDEAFAHGAFYVALSRVRRMADLMLFGTVPFPEKDPDFHLNDLIQQMDQAFQEQNEI
jgi:hypothetical protein